MTATNSLPHIRSPTSHSPLRDGPVWARLRLPLARIGAAAARAQVLEAPAGGDPRSAAGGSPLSAASPSSYRTHRESFPSPLSALSRSEALASPHTDAPSPRSTLPPFGNTLVDAAGNEATATRG